MLKNLRKPTCILLAIIIVFHMSIVYASTTDYITDGNISWNISIDSICKNFTSFNIGDLFDMSKYNYDCKDGLFLDVSFGKIGVNLKGDDLLKTDLLDKLFINLLKDVRRIERNMNLFNYVERKKSLMSKFCLV